MTYGAVNTVTTADVEHATEAISDVSNVGLLNWQCQSLTCHVFSSIHHCMLVEDSSRPILIIL